MEWMNLQDVQRDQLGSFKTTWQGYCFKSAQISQPGGGGGEIMSGWERSGGERKDTNGSRIYMYREIPGVPNNGLENRKKKREVACSRSTTTIGRERSRWAV